MFRSTAEQKQLYLTADLRTRRTLEERSMQTKVRPGCNHFESQLQRFPPIDDLVAALDRIASRTFEA
jgi:hypothetical protein